MTILKYYAFSTALYQYFIFEHGYISHSWLNFLVVTDKRGQSQHHTLTEMKTKHKCQVHIFWNILSFKKLWTFKAQKTENLVSKYINGVRHM